jgi:ribosomal protein S18 acetylase RimI-like enzyme
MRLREIITESQISINQYSDNASLEGYVVDTSLPQLKNYLAAQGVQQNLAELIAGKFSRVAVIRNLYVDEESRGQGLGRKLVNNAIDEAFDAGAEAIVLVADADEDNSVDLVQWYKDYGFDVVGTAHGNPVMLLQPDQ